VQKLLVVTSLTPAPPTKASSGHKRLFLLHCTLYIHVYLLVHLSFQELYWNLSCIFIGTYVLNTRTWVQLAAKLIGSVEVEWFPVTRELYRSCNVYIPATTIRMMDGVVIMIHDFSKNPVCVDKNLIRSQCVVAVVKRLKVLATCREIW
jgi:hypothetical protein